MPQKVFFKYIYFFFITKRGSEAKESPNRPLVAKGHQPSTRTIISRPYCNSETSDVMLLRFIKVESKIARYQHTFGVDDRCVSSRSTGVLVPEVQNT